MEKEWIIKDADRYFYSLGVKRATRGLPFADEKNPARAYTYSLLFWGAGQNYSGLRAKSMLFQIFMVIFLAVFVLPVLFAKELTALLQVYAVSRADFFLSAELVLFCVLVFWIYNAGDAYHAAVKTRRVLFRGVRSKVLPLICSLLVPGWGQFLNGQPVKGGLLAGFSVFNIFSVVTIPAVLFCWPYLELSPARSIIEMIFAVTVLYAPLVPVVSLLGGYDALKVSLHDMKKDSLLDRITTAINRMRSAGWLRSAVPPLKSILLLAFIAFLVVLINDYLPAKFYSGHLAKTQAWLHEIGMTLVPDMINRLIS